MVIDGRRSLWHSAPASRLAVILRNTCSHSARRSSTIAGRGRVAASASHGGRAVNQARGCAAAAAPRLVGDGTTPGSRRRLRRRPRSARALCPRPARSRRGRPVTSFAQGWRHLTIGTVHAIIGRRAVDARRRRLGAGRLRPGCAARLRPDRLPNDRLRNGGPGNGGLGIDRLPAAPPLPYDRPIGTAPVGSPVGSGLDAPVSPRPFASPSIDLGTDPYEPPAPPRGTHAPRPGSTTVSEYVEEIGRTAGERREAGPDTRLDDPTTRTDPDAETPGDRSFISRGAAPAAVRPVSGRAVSGRAVPGGCHARRVGSVERVVRGDAERRLLRGRQYERPEHNRPEHEPASTRPASTRPASTPPVPTRSRTGSMSARFRSASSSAMSLRTCRR